MGVPVARTRCSRRCGRNAREMLSSTRTQWISGGGDSGSLTAGDSGSPATGDSGMCVVVALGERQCAERGEGVSVGEVTG
jgi:hypothetical protein